MNQKAENNAEEIAENIEERAENIDDTEAEEVDPNDADYQTRAKAPIPETPRRSNRNKGVRPLSLKYFALFTADPLTVKEALASNDCEKWKMAMKEEINSHAANETWTIADLPQNRRRSKRSGFSRSKTMEVIVRFDIKLD